MNKTIMRIILATLFLLACGTSQLMADGGEPRPPFCCPGCSCR